jgi:hypothetical protein
MREIWNSTAVREEMEKCARMVLGLPNTPPESDKITNLPVGYHDIAVLGTVSYENRSFIVRVALINGDKDSVLIKLEDRVLPLNRRSVKSGMRMTLTVELVEGQTKITHIRINF